MMIEPSVEDFTIKGGTTYIKTWDFLNEDETPMDLTGWAARMQLRPSIDSDTVSLELTTENGGIVIESDDTGDYGEGSLTLIIADSDTSDLVVGFAKTKYVYDLEVIYPTTNYVNCPLQGKITVTPEVTR